MRRSIPILILLLGFIVSACATSSFTQTGESYPRHNGFVKVFFETPQDIQYDEIGIVSSKGGAIHDQADMIKALQKKAAKYGANAIILISEKEDKNAIFSAGQYGAFGATATYKYMTAIAVRVREGN